MESFGERDRDSEENEPLFFPFFLLLFFFLLARAKRKNTPSWKKVAHS